uniref:Pyridoxal phosphate homeostasis protein n=1 Tax=candidate division WOR-3 bacterium TaxID=2052148 RepID=A0A7C4YEV3_UNCW3
MNEITIVAATKYFKPEEIMKIIEGGIYHIGENYVQDLLLKYNFIKEKTDKKIYWHFIGHLQKNKVKKIIDFIDFIQTLDSVELAEEINKRAKRKVSCFIEINSGREPQKSGILPEEFSSFIEKIKKFENIRIEGVMTMGPLVENPEDIRPYFRLTREIFEKLKEDKDIGKEVRYLSMGMSDTYKIAIEEGANMIRIGRKIFEFLKNPQH